jgi:6-carboxyhexanoate--CoA ligase
VTEDRDLFSVRMRAASDGRHVSGAETSVPERRVAEAAAGMVSRALGHPRGDPDDVTVSIDRLDEAPLRVPALPVVTVEAAGVDAGRRAARRLLDDAGVPAVIVDRAFDLLERDTADHGAALLDTTGTRRDPNPERGVRVSRLGTSERGASALDAALDAHDLPSTRVRDALVLATKVVRAPGVVAELCRSDNPEYTAGYVATAEGYYRFPALKPAGDPRGGRVFLLAPDADVARTVDFLETRPVVVDDVRSFDRVPPAAVGDDG